ncbi:hypothetical protein [Robertmurraya siralis]|nr:hypothetical protein [Robertmurraya siralis]
MDNLNVIKNRYAYSDDRKCCDLQTVFETDLEDHSADIAYLIDRSVNQ